MGRAMEAFLTLFRIAYGLFFIAVDAWVAFMVSRGEDEIFPQTREAAAAFSKALADTGFVNPLMAATFLAGGLCLLFKRTAPLGIVLLAPSVTIVFFFHVFLTGNWAWGAFWAAGLALLAWRFRAAFRPLWSFEVGGSDPTPATASVDWTR